MAPRSFGEAVHGTLAGFAEPCDTDFRARLVRSRRTLDIYAGARRSTTSAKVSAKYTTLVCGSSPEKGIKGAINGRNPQRVCTGFSHLGWSLRHRERFRARPAITNPTFPGPGNS